MTLILFKIIPFCEAKPYAHLHGLRLVRSAQRSKPLPDVNYFAVDDDLGGRDRQHRRITSHDLQGIVSMIRSSGSAPGGNHSATEAPHVAIAVGPLVQHGAQSHVLIADSSPHPGRGP